MTKTKNYIEETLGSVIWGLFCVYNSYGLTYDDIADKLYDDCIISYIERDIIKSFKGE